MKKQAQTNDAPDNVVSAIENLPEEAFETMADVAHADGQEDGSKISGEEHGEATEMARSGGSQSGGGGDREGEGEGSRKGGGSGSGSRSSR